MSSQDIEWVINKKGFFITKLDPHIWKRINKSSIIISIIVISESFPGVNSPLTISIIKIVTVLSF